MKTSLKNQYTYVNQLLIVVVSAVLGYNLYQEIAHPENSRLTLSIILVVLTYIVVEKYSHKPEKEIKK
ncbi:hypothetical protein ACFQO9_17900 [Chryseobacterium zhengzhouense]|uniref:Uncharacterized protein n=1 Tax=Chryseobacterium zhengzhouense TaxID=1636086 RepID=A0ABW2M306_9FLAO